MRVLIVKFLSFIMYVISIIITYKSYLRIKRYCNLLYTMWIRNFLGELGNQSVVDYPCILQGGGLKQIKIGERSRLQAHCILGCWNEYGGQRFSPTITIGSSCNIGEYNQITACNRIVIGNGLLTGRFVYIGDNAHGGLSWADSRIPPANRSLISKGEIVIGDNVWIGDKVTILYGVNIGDNVIVGANSVITHNVPSNCIVAGSPAKIVRQLL